MALARLAIRLCTVCLLALAGGSLAPPSAAAATDTTRVREIASVALHPWRLEIHRDDSLLSPLADRETRERTFAELQALGITQARVDLKWHDVEPNPPGSATELLLGDGRDWSTFDSVLASAARYGVTLTPMVSYVPGWANGNDHYFAYPTDMRTFERFFAAALLRYPQIEAWEIWNEPNHPNFARPVPDVGRFVALLRAAHAARAAVGSDAKLISGGLAAGNGMSGFVERMADQGALDYIDGLGVHPYSRVAADERGSGLLRLPGLYGRLVERGKGHIRLWVTEYGTPDSTQGSEYGEPADERRQARRLQRAYALAARWPFVANLTWYEFRDACADPGTPICRLGLVRPELARKQSALALRDLLAGAEAPQLRTAVSLRVARSRRHRVRGTVFAPDLDLTGRRVLVTVVRRARHPERSRARRLRRLKPRLRHGRFRLALGRLHPGRYRITARFPGDARHAPSQKTTAIVVRAAPKRAKRSRGG